MKLPAIHNKLFFALLVLVHLIYFLQAIFGANIFTQDSVDYLSQAENLVKYNSLYAKPCNEPIQLDWFTFRPPVYGLFILVVKSLYSSNYAVLLVQSLLSISTFLGVIKFTKKLNLNVNLTYWFLLLACVFYPSQFIHCNLIMSDILFQSILFWAFYFAYILLVEPNLKTAWICSFLFVGAMLTKPVSFLLGFTLVFIIVFVWFKKHNLKLLLPFLLLPVTYHSYCKYNQYVTGYYHYTSVTPYFVLKYMGKYTNAQLFGENYADSVQEEIMTRVDAQPNHKLRYELMNVEGKKIINQHKFTFLLFNVKGWIAFMVDPGRYDWYRFLNINEGNFPGLYHSINTKGVIQGLVEFLKFAPVGILLILLVSLLWNVAIFVLFVWFLLSNKFNWQIRLLVFLWVGYIVGSTGVLGLARYRIAVAPQLFVAAIFVLNYLQEKLILKHANR